MARLRTISLATLLLAAWGMAGADTLDMQGVAAPGSDGRPTRGMTQASVEAKFGAPAAVKAPVGDPPITRWVYPGYTVYFEGDRVIEVVVHR